MEEIERALDDIDTLTACLRDIEPFVYRVSFQLTGHRQDAEDLGQEALVKICRQLHAFRGESSFQSWVYRIIVNTQRDLWRHKKGVEFVEWQENDQRDAPAAEGPEGQVSHKLALQELLQEVKGVDRQIFFLRFAEDRPVKEMAALLEMKESAVKSRLWRLRDRLKEKWQRIGGDEL
ncbi:MAG TPA: RNA polymerase sigma factor [Bacilli bacterium]|nr:RNA polymerase sigma factor [Bacilli bacterium]